MYEYEYFAIHTDGVGVNNAYCPHRKIITEFAKKGWRYMGYIPVSFTGYDKLSEIDLIFERKIS